MLRSDAPLRRRLATVLLVFQVGLVGAFAPLEFARAGGATAGAHVERAGEDGCPPPHDAGRCRVCQAVSPRVAVTVSDLPSFAPVWVARVARPRPHHPAPRHVLQPGRPRAPPALPT